MVARDETTKKFVSLPENEITLQAFELYYAMGDSRSYVRVAREIHRAPQTIFNWAKKFDWKERVKERNIKLSRELEASSIERSAGIRVQYSRECGRLVNDFFRYIEGKKKAYLTDLKQYTTDLRTWKRKVASGEWKREDKGKRPNRPEPYSPVKNIKDLEALVRLQLLLMGEDVDNPMEKEIELRESRVAMLMNSDEEVRSLLAEVWRRMKCTS